MSPAIKVKLSTRAKPEAERVGEYLKVAASDLRLLSQSSVSNHHAQRLMDWADDADELRQQLHTGQLQIVRQR